MHNFDDLLRKALGDANLMQFEGDLEGANTTEFDFSAGYRRERMRILSDPFGWAKQMGRPLWKKVMRTAACVVLAFTLALGTLMGVSPTVRAAVLNWLREISGSEIIYHSASENERDTPLSWRPTWLPEGWTTTMMFSRSGRSWWEFEDSGDSGAGLTCACFDSSTESMSTIFNDTDVNRLHTTTTMQGYSADYYEGKLDSLLVWENKEGYLFWVKGWRVDRATLEKVAESMTFYDAADTVYEMGWVPEGYEPKSRLESIGVVQEDWGKDGVTLVWQYVTDPISPLEVPKREPEHVTVMGRPAKYWACQVTEEDPGTDMVGDSGFQVYVSYSTEESGVLTWTDPETNTSFRLKGILGKEDLLRMAESVTGKNSHKISKR